MTLLAAAQPVSAQRRYLVEAIDIDVTVQADGTLEIREALSYDFRGAFTFAFRNIPRGADDEVARIRVSEDGRDYRESDSNEPGTFVITEEAASTRVTWYYRADTERRTFDFAYTIAGGVRRYRDTAEFYYKFVGDDWDRTIGNVRAVVRFPSPPAPTDLRAWAHGPLNGSARINADGTVAFDVSSLPAGEFWEGRLLFPTALVADLALASSDPRVDEVLNEELVWVEEANALREANQRRLEQQAAARVRRDVLAGRLFPVALGLAFVGLLAWFLAFRRHGRPHDVHVHAVPGEFPSDHAPALVGYLMSRSVGASSIVATLLDLAHRGHFQIRETVELKRGFFREKREVDYQFERTEKPFDELEPFERDLVDFLLGQSDSSTGFAVSVIRKTASKHRAEFHKWFAAWLKKVEARGKLLGFFEPYAVRAMVLNAGIGVAMIVTGIVFSVMSQSPAGLPAIVAGALVAGLTVTLNRRTVEGRRLFLGWTAFRSYLKSLSKSLGPVSLDADTWGRYLATSVVFGLHKQLLPKLQPTDERGQPAVPFFFVGVPGDSFNDSVSSLASSVSSMVTSVSTSMSSASGVGGGATGGGGGGAGGGGGGAG